MSTTWAFHVLSAWDGFSTISTMANDVFTVVCHTLPKPRESKSARAGIRIRVSGMKTHHDGPGYTTRATTRGRHSC